jgi:hypothetical protein
VIERIVDLLPRRFWSLGNVYLGARLHFCVGPGDEGTSVRTVEWYGREIAHGRRPFDPG